MVDPLSYFSFHPVLRDITNFLQLIFSLFSFFRVSFLHFLLFFIFILFRLPVSLGLICDTRTHTKIDIIIYIFSIYF